MYFISRLIKSVRSAVKLSRYSSRERSDSGYESNEDTEDYLEQIITNHQQQIHVYPLLHTSRSPNMERRGTTIDDLISSKNDRRASRSASSSNLPRRYIQRSASMSAQKTRRQSSVGSSQSLKPIIHRRSTLFDSSMGSLIRLTSTPRLNDDDTYLSTRFRNENTSKFVIGTLWNTFALVNNLFLQRPRKRRNAIAEENIQTEQLAHLRQLYSLAEQDQNNELTLNNNLQSVIREALLEPETNNLQSIIFDILSTNKKQHCTCYGNHHISSCIYYDHSLPYIKRYLDNTSELERVFYDIEKSNKPKVQDASTQSYIEKPIRTFIHSKSMNNAATQSSPIGTYRSHVSTQVTPIENENVSTRYSLEKISSKKTNPKKIDDETIYDRRNSLMNELKQVISSSDFKLNTTNEENKYLPNHTVRSLVSIFETTKPIIKKSNLPIQQNPITTNSIELTPPDSALLNISTEEIQSSIVHDTIEQYANEIASNIVDNAVLTATTTAVYHNEQLHRRFSFYKNGGGHGKSLLFQSNTFVPLNERRNEEVDQNLRGIFYLR